MIMIERTKQKFKLFRNKNEEGLTRLYMKTDIILLADVFEKFIKVSNKDYGNIPLYCVSTCSYSLQCQNLQFINYKHYKIRI